MLNFLLNLVAFTLNPFDLYVFVDFHDRLKLTLRDKFDLLETHVFKVFDRFKLILEVLGYFEQFF